MSEMLLDDEFIQNDDDKRQLVFEGFFAYSISETEEIRVPFRIEAFEEDGSFNGFATDEETDLLFEKGTIKLEGFIEDNLISFVKTYPRFYLWNEKDELELAVSDKPHRVEYFGTWIEEEQMYTGNYVVVMAEHWEDRHKGIYTTEEYSGYWEMKQLKTTDK